MILRTYNVIGNDNKYEYINFFFFNLSILFPQNDNRPWPWSKDAVDMYRIIATCYINILIFIGYTDVIFEVGSYDIIYSITSHFIWKYIQLLIGKYFYTSTNHATTYCFFTAIF